MERTGAALARDAGATHIRNRHDPDRAASARGPAAALQANPFTADQSEARLQTARNMSAMWASFARTGVPSAPGQPVWKSYSLERRETMLIDAQCRLVSDPEGEERRFWQREPDTEAIR